jgi:hypothetical protein
MFRLMLSQGVATTTAGAAQRLGGLAGLRVECTGDGHVVRAA